MTINFCLKCKSLLSPSSSKESLPIECKKCGFKQKPRKELISSEKIKKGINKGEGAASDENIYANYEHICKKCGYDKAQIIDMGIKYSDEDNLIFLKCGKCSFSERIGRKIS